MPGRRTVLGAVAFAMLVAGGLTARVLYLRREILAETGPQLARSLESTRPVLDVWRDGHVAQAALLARLAALEPVLADARTPGAPGAAARRLATAKLDAALGALDPRRGVVGGWIYDADGKLLAGDSASAPTVPHVTGTAAHATTGRDARGVHVDVAAPIAGVVGAREGTTLGTVLLRIRVSDSTFAALNPTRPGNRGGRTTLVARAGDSILIVATATSGDDVGHRRAFALADAPAHVRAALDGRATHGVERGLFAPRVVYAGLTVPALGWALVREQRVDALYALVRTPIIVDQIVLGTIAVLLALTVVGIVRASRARRATALAQLRADFVSAVSHELRTPLAQIRLFAELLRKQALRDPAEADRALGVIEKEAGRLSILVDNILSYTSLRRRQRFVTPLAADVAMEARQVIESFAPLAAERGARVVADLEAGTRARIDTQALRQVLLNFLENAVKYGPKGQTVTVGARYAMNGQHEARVRLWVDDQGAGVPAAERAMVWDAFYRTEHAQRSGVGGSGLGLAVVRDLVAQYGGAALVEEAPGGGARFVVELPGLKT